MDSQNLLIAPCGMNCGLCLAHLRKKDKCPGCRLDDSPQAISRARCKIKNCPNLHKENHQFCFECHQFPCQNLKHLDNRYKNKYYMSMIENLDHIRKFGIQKFIADEKAKWTCRKCGGVICVHRGSCIDCGTKI